MLGGVYGAGVVTTILFDACSGERCNQDWPMYLPVVGPFVEIHSLLRGNKTLVGWIPAAVVAGLAQTTGAVLLITGLTLSSRLKQPPALLLPATLPGGAGLSLVGRF